MSKDLSNGVHRVFCLPSKISPDNSVAWKFGFAKFHMEVALSALTHVERQRVATVLHDYADRIGARTGEGESDPSSMKSKAQELNSHVAVDWAQAGTDKQGPKLLFCHSVDLNVQADKPTADGSIYPRKVLEEAIHEKALDVFVGPVEQWPPRDEDKVGVMELRLQEDGKVVGSGFLRDKPGLGDLMLVKDMLDRGELQFSIGGVGTIS